MFLSTRDEFDFKPLWKGLVQLQGNVTYIDIPLGELLEIPDGFQCDLASYQIISKILFDKLGTSMRPAFVHDWVYTNQPEEISRAHADRIFKEALIHEGASAASAWSQWAGVRAGGWVAWDRHARRNALKKADTTVR